LQTHASQRFLLLASQWQPRVQAHRDPAVILWWMPSAMLSQCGHVQPLRDATTTGHETAVLGAAYAAAAAQRLVATIAVALR
jgi:hypothetical protein